MLFNANLKVLGTIKSKLNHFQEPVLDIQVDNTLDPGASPATGARYIISNAASLHANFGSISGLADDDIVEYNGSAFEIAFDASAAGEGAICWISDVNEIHEFDGSAWNAPAVAADEKVKVSANDTTAKYLEDSIVVSSGSNASTILEISTLNDGGNEDFQIQIDESKINHDNLAGFVANEHIDHSSVSITAGTGLTGGGDITASRTLNLADTAVTPGSYGDAQTVSTFTVDQQGRLTAAGQVTVDDNTKIPLTQKGAANGVATLDGSGKVPVAQLPSAVMTYEGVWNASTNSPTLADGGAHDVGMVYRVSVAGTQNLGSGNITFDVGDYAIYNSSLVWEKSDTTDAVASVNGQTGIVVLDTDDVAEAANLYFTDERAQDAIGSILLDTATIDFTYDDATPNISAIVKDNSIDENKLTASVAGDGIQGGNGSALSLDLKALSGLEIDTAELAIKLEADGGIQFDGTNGGLELKLNSTALSLDSNGLAVATDGEGIQVGASGLELELDGSTLSKTASGVKASISGLLQQSHIATWAPGDGASKVVTHSFGTDDVIVEIYDSNKETIFIDSIDRSSTNAVTLTASEAPAANYTVIVKQAASTASL